MENLTFVKGSRDRENLDPVSAAILEVASTGTSIFDPVLCEIAYRWFCPPGGAVLDPFAGGSVRGIVASKLGRPYTGIDLRAEQIDGNRSQAEQICGDPMPRWVCGDSREVMPALAQNGIAPQFDFIFSCPPYADLEVYSDDPRDLSTFDYDEFRAAYANIIGGACALLKPDRFACFVVGDVRDQQGFYRNFPGHDRGVRGCRPSPLQRGHPGDGGRLVTNPSREAVRGNAQAWQNPSKLPRLR